MNANTIVTVLGISVAVAMIMTVLVAITSSLLTFGTYILQTVNFSNSNCGNIYSARVIHYRRNIMFYHGCQITFPGFRRVSLTSETSGGGY